MHIETISYQAGDSLLKGYYANEETIGNRGKKPAVLVCHDWSGCNDFAREKAQRLAELGYIGFALDMYGQGSCGTTQEEKVALMKPLMENRRLLRQRIQAALMTVKTLDLVDAERIAAIGFCFGGLCVLDLARSGEELCGVVSFHGLLAEAEGLPKAKIKAKVLVLHGYEDPMSSFDQVHCFAKEMTEASVDWQLTLYSQTQHAFMNPKAQDKEQGLVYHALTSKRAWMAMKTFLQEVFV